MVNSNRCAVVTEALRYNFGTGFLEFFMRSVTTKIKVFFAECARINGKCRVYTLSICTPARVHIHCRRYSVKDFAGGLSYTINDFFDGIIIGANDCPPFFSTLAFFDMNLIKTIIAFAYLIGSTFYVFQFMASHSCGRRQIV